MNVWPWKKVRNSSCSPRKPCVDALGRQRRGERQVAAGQALAEAQEVRRDAAPARRRTSCRCGRTRSRPRRRSAARRARRRARGRGAGSPGGWTRIPPAPWTSGSMITAAISSPWRSSSRAERRRRRRPAPSASRTAAARRRRGRGRCRRPRRPRSCRRGSRRARPTNDVRAGVLAALLLPVLERHLQRDLDRGRAGVGVEDAGQAGRARLDEPRRELGRRRVREPEHRRVRDAVELVADRARRSSGWRWPWTLHHSDEMPSM